MVDSSSFLVYLVLLATICNPSCLSCLLVCAEEGNKRKKKVGNLNYQGNEWLWELRLLLKVEI